MSERVLRLSTDCTLRLFSTMSVSEATAWMTQLVAEVPLEQRAIQLFGKSVIQPRLIGWAGEVPYTYSRQTLEPRPWGACLARLLEHTVTVCAHPFNHALVNLYRDGADSMGMHSDDEPALGKNPVVASWSFGAKRTFVLASKAGSDRFRLELSSGTLLVMAGATQHHFRHGVPKDERVSEPRLNVTFRNVLADGSAA